MRKIMEMIKNISRKATLCGALIGLSGCASTQIQDDSYVTGIRKNIISNVQAGEYIKEAFDWYNVSHQLNSDEKINLLKIMDRDNDGKISEEEAKYAKDCAEAKYKPLLEEAQKILEELNKEIDSTQESKK